MIQIKRNLIVAPEKRKKNGVLIDENVPIRIRVNFNGSRIDVQTGYRIDLKKWDENKSQVKNGSFNKYGQSSSVINNGIMELQMKIQNLFQSFENEEKIPSKDDIKNLVKNLKSSKQGSFNTESEIKSMFQIFDIFTKENGRKNNWTDATFTKFKTIKKHLEEFEPALKFQEINHDRLTDYIIFLSQKQKLRNSTIKKNLSFVKWFLKWSLESNYHSNDVFQTFKPKIKNADNSIVFLTEEDKRKILEADIPDSKEYLHRVRDVLMFCCYTGLRYSDVYNLKRTDIQENYIQITTVKTSDSLTIEFNKHSKTILEKYKDIPFPGNKALPVISNQKMNEYLKELGELAKLTTKVRQTYYIGNKRVDDFTPKSELLSTHVGRRTFICSALSLGIPVQVVMKWTGHKDYKSMKPYIDVADKIKQVSMAKFDQL